MEMNALINRIVDKEWTMFHSVNGEDRVSCQEDRSSFYALRGAQFSAWSQAAVESYLSDLENAEKEGRNLAREKYIHMMKSTDPVGYEKFKGELPEISPEKERLVAGLWSHFLEQTKKMQKKHPIIALGGRPLLASEDGNGETSIETYQTGELLTYSEVTLKALLAHLLALEAEGIDLAYRIQENSVTCMGYATMDEAEAAMAEQLLRMMGATECSGCGCGCE